MDCMSIGVGVLQYSADNSSLKVVHPYWILFSWSVVLNHIQVNCVYGYVIIVMTKWLILFDYIFFNAKLSFMETDKEPTIYVILCNRPYHRASPLYLCSMCSLSTCLCTYKSPWYKYHLYLLIQCFGVTCLKSSLYDPKPILWVAIWCIENRRRKRKLAITDF